MSTAALLKDLGIPQSDLCRASGLSRSAVSRLCAHGQWPRLGADLARAAIEGYLRQRGLSDAQQHALLQALDPIDSKLAPASSQLAKAPPEAPKPTETQEVQPMLLRHESLTPAARRHFKLARSPFMDDIQSQADIYASQHGRYVRAALLDAATHHGFIAVVGESGSGKSTLREDLEERVRDERRPIVLIKPYVLGLEPTEARGKPMRVGQIAESIVHALAPGMPLKNSPQARYHQVHELLRASRSAGYTHLMVIEEAHRMPLPTLKHLKNFMELKDGLRRLLGVALIGQPELDTLLDERNPEVREIVQRCERIRMEPLDGDLQAYLEHKFERVGARLSDVADADSIDAMRQRLISIPRGGRAADALSLCYPLVVNNLMCRALNAAAAVGYPKVDAQVVAGC